MGSIARGYKPDHYFGSAPPCPRGRDCGKSSPIIRIILRCNIFFAALHGILFRCREVLHLAPADLAATVAPARNRRPAADFARHGPARERLAAARRSPPGGAPITRASRLATSPGCDRPKTGNAVGIVEIPPVLDQADEVADRRIGRPSATKRRTREIRRNPRFEKGANIGFRADRFDRRQAGGIERGLRGRLFRFIRRRRSSGGVLRLDRRGLIRRFAFAPRPSIEKFFRLAHGCSSSRNGRRPSASGSARSRFRLENSRSTWCSATKSATACWIAFGIGTVSTRSLPARSWLRLRPDRPSPSTNV